MPKMIYDELTYDRTISSSWRHRLRNGHRRTCKKCKADALPHSVYCHEHHPHRDAYFIRLRKAVDGATRDLAVIKEGLSKIVQNPVDLI